MTQQATLLQVPYTSPEGYVIRPATAAEHPLIYSDFLKSLHAVTPWKDIPNRVFFKEYHDLLEQALATQVVLVAEEPTEKVVLGWVIGLPSVTDTSPLIVMYVYAKQLYRNMGVESALLYALWGNGVRKLGGYSVVFLTNYQVSAVGEAGLPGRIQWITEQLFRNRVQTGAARVGVNSVSS